MGLVHGVIVEVVDWDGEVVGWVESFGVDVVAFEEVAGIDCISLDF